MVDDGDYRELNKVVAPDHAAVPDMAAIFGTLAMLLVVSHAELD